MMSRFLFLALVAYMTMQPALAATVRYKYTFFDQAGTVIGQGGLSYDPGVKVDLYALVDYPGAVPCYYPSPGTCELRYIWTPIQLWIELYGESYYSTNTLYLEGTDTFHKSVGGYVEGWWFWNYGQGVYLDLQPPLNYQGPTLEPFYAIIPGITQGDEGLEGYVLTFAVPVPGALILFSIGGMMLTLAARKAKLHHCLV